MANLLAQICTQNLINMKQVCSNKLKGISLEATVASLYKSLHLCD
jgi:hypothetical protein